MGHAGAIISGSAGTAQAKKDALEARGIRVGTTPTETAQLVAEIAARAERVVATTRPRPAAVDEGVSETAHAFGARP